MEIAVMHVEGRRVVESAIGAIRTRIEAVVVMMQSMVVADMVLIWTSKLRASMWRRTVIELLVSAVRKKMQRILRYNERLLLVLLVRIVYQTITAGKLAEQVRVLRRNCRSRLEAVRLGANRGSQL